MSRLKRNPRTEPIVIPLLADIDDATVVDVSEISGGSLKIPTGGGTTEVAVYCAYSGGVYASDYGPAEDDNRDHMTFPVVAGRGTPLPPEIFNYELVKFIASGGTATDPAFVFIKG